MAIDRDQSNGFALCDQKELDLNFSNGLWVPRKFKKIRNWPRHWTSFRYYIGAGWSSPVAREAHNLEVAGSNPVPATNPPTPVGGFFLAFWCDAIQGLFGPLRP